MTANEHPGLLEANKRAGEAVEVLKSAIERLHPPREGEGLADVALRLRGAVVLAHSAGTELAVVNGVERSGAHGGER